MFSTITLTTFTLYLLFTVWITQRRVKLRQELVDVDNARNAYFIDSILNHEVVKYFTSEEKESKKFDSYLFKIQKLNIDSTYAIALLNLGQTTMFCTGLTISLLIALKRVQTGLMSVGDLVAVNSMLLQLSIPFNFMGYTCKFYMYKLLVYFYCVNLYSYHPFQKK
jgi:ATP-binding cassette subfamily B protein